MLNLLLGAKAPSLSAILVRVIFACSVSVEFVSHRNIVMGHASHHSALSLYSSDIFDLP